MSPLVDSPPEGKTGDTVTRDVGFVSRLTRNVAVPPFSATVRVAGLVETLALSLSVSVTVRVLENAAYTASSDATDVEIVTVGSVAKSTESSTLSTVTVCASENVPAVKVRTVVPNMVASDVSSETTVTTAFGPSGADPRTIVISNWATASEIVADVAEVVSAAVSSSVAVAVTSESNAMPLNWASVEETAAVMVVVRSALSTASSTMVTVTARGEFQFPVEKVNGEAETVATDVSDDVMVTSTLLDGAWSSSRSKATRPPFSTAAIVVVDTTRDPRSSSSVMLIVPVKVRPLNAESAEEHVCVMTTFASAVATSTTLSTEVIVTV